MAPARGALDGGSLPDLRGERPHVRVTIDRFALCAARGAPGVSGGSLGWTGPINPETARRLACDASVSRLVTGPDGLPLDVGRAQRTASAAVRRAVEIRDGTASSPAATPRRSGATSTTSSTGRTAARPAATTARCSASGTTRRATKVASASGEIPARATGTPTGRTGPRFSAARGRDAERPRPPLLTGSQTRAAQDATATCCTRAASTRAAQSRARVGEKPSSAQAAVLSGAISGLGSSGMAA